MQFLLPLAGGALIGLAATLLLLTNGRVAGVSGILSRALSSPVKDGLWRFCFIGGLVAGGLILRLLNPSLFHNTSGRSLATILLAGFLVGFGTVMGGGCTSGHGVCGVSRLSKRSLLATLVFVLVGFLTVAVMRLGGWR